MMTNNNHYQSRHNAMSTSSTFNTNNPEFRRVTSFTANINPFETPQKTFDNNFQDTNGDSYPRAMASQSMIAPNTSSNNKRPTFGKLDSMARKITTTFQEDTLNDFKPKLENHFKNDDNVTQSMVVQNQGQQRQFFGFNKIQQNSKFQPDLTEPPQKKRRESIDLGFSNRPQRVGETIPPFMRKYNHDQAKQQKNVTQQSQSSLNNGNQGFKLKQFQFLKNKKDNLLSENSAASSVHNVHSMKNLQQFSLNNPYKKTEFLSPTVPTMKPLANDIKYHQQKGKLDMPIKGDLFGSNNHLNSPSGNFEFKKKKFGQSPIELTIQKPILNKQLSNSSNKEPITAKQRRQAKIQREIKLSDFQLLDKLGKGAFGDVYMAQEKIIGFICVIKKMSKKRIREMKVQEHVLREIKIQSYLNHKNLTAFFGCFTDDDHIYLIIEALPDGSLQQVKKKKKIPQKETAAIIKQVGEGLRYMHEEYIIHRDLKPQNIFVNDGVFKIGDFGCSIYNKDQGMRTTVVGCLEYSSPQQLSKVSYSQKIDSWSLGILTYELLFGKSPFQKDIINITKNKDLKAELSDLVFPPSIPIKQNTMDFIQNLLAENPQKRMDMDEVLVHPFLKQEMAKKPSKLQLL